MRYSLLLMYRQPLRSPRAERADVKKICKTQCEYSKSARDNIHHFRILNVFVCNQIGTNVVRRKKYKFCLFFFRLV